MRAFWTIFVAIFLILYGVSWCTLRHNSVATPTGVTQPWIDTYYAQARLPLFTAFFTLGSFLLALQTGILQRLREGFDAKDYEDQYRNLKRKNPETRYYGSLERLSTALSTNVILALLTSAAQMTLGFIKKPSTVAFSISLAIATLGLVITLTIHIFKAHRYWFQKIEDEKLKNLVN